jgi:hypothetical protein
MQGAVGRLAERCERDGIAYCALKGAGALAGALAGERDLDWLVAPADWERALRALAHTGWKAARPRAGRDLPDTAHFFAFEPGQERLLHLHLHDRVLSGEDLLPSHALPLDAPLLASPACAAGLRVPTPAQEALLLVLKHAVRWGSLPDLALATLRPKPEPEGLAALLAAPVLDEAALLLRAHLPGVEEGAFRAAAASLRAGRFELRRLRLTAELRRALRPWRCRGSLARAAGYLALALRRLRRALDGNRRDRVPASGGALLALAGAEAEQATRLARWLGQAFAVRSVRSGEVDGRALAAGELVILAGEAPSAAALGADPARCHRLDLGALGGDETQLRERVWELL